MNIDKEIELAKAKQQTAEAWSKILSIITIALTATSVISAAILGYSANNTANILAINQTEIAKILKHVKDLKNVSE